MYPCLPVLDDMWLYCFLILPVLMICGYVVSLFASLGWYVVILFPYFTSLNDLWLCCILVCQSSWSFVMLYPCLPVFMIFCYAVCLFAGRIMMIRMWCCLTAACCRHITASCVCAAISRAPSHGIWHNIRTYSGPSRTSPPIPRSTPWWEHWDFIR